MRRCAILAGGSGSRIGGEKANVVLAGKTLLERALLIAREAGLKPIVVAKATTALQPRPDRVLVEPDEPRHPLAGIAAALERIGEPIVVCPCDMPLLDPAALRALATGEAPLRILTGPDGPQPLVGRYPPELAGELAAAATAGAAATEIVLGLGAELLELGPAEGLDPATALRNVNTPADLAEIESLLAEPTVR